MTTRTVEQGDGYYLSESDDPAIGPGIGLERLTEAGIAAMRRANVQRVTIGPQWPHDSLDALVAAAPGIRELNIAELRMRSTAAIGELRDVEVLSSSASGTPPDYSRLSKLRKALLGAPAELGNIGDAPNLRDLAVFDARLTSLAPLANLTTLMRLHLNSIKGLKSLEGIERLPLEEFVITRAPGLRSLAPLRAVTTLRSLEINYASKLDGLDVLGGIPSLRSITVDHGPPIGSLEFVQSLRALDTLVLEGAGTGHTLSLTPLASLPRLRDLVLQGFPKARLELTDIEAVTALRGLERLGVVFGPASIPTIAWARSLTNLRSFGLLETTIGDGDASVLLDLPHLIAARLKPYPKRYRPAEAELKRVVKSREEEQGSLLKQRLATKANDR